MIGIALNIARVDESILQASSSIVPLVLEEEPDLSLAILDELGLSALD